MSLGIGAFVGVAAVVIMTPGQDTALVIRSALSGGGRRGVFTALGVAAGQTAWVVASAVGLTALVVASAPAFKAIQLAGAGYLVFLGGRSLVAAFDARANHPAALRVPTTTPLSAFRQGLLSALTNPKLAAFFLSLFPQFVPAGGSSLGTLLGLGLLFCLMTLAWLSLYALAIEKGGVLLGRDRVRRVVQGVMGAVLVGLGLKLATADR